MDLHNDTLEKYGEDYELLEALQVLQEVELRDGIDSDPFVHALSVTGKLLNARGVYLDALGYFIRGRGVLELREEQLHPFMCELLTGIGENYLLQGMLVEALPYYQKALSVGEALCIGETVEAASVHMKAGEILCMQGDLFEAKEHMLRAYQILKAVDTDNYCSLGDVAHNLGIILFSEEHSNRAVDYLKEAEECRKKHFGEQSIERADSLWALGKCYVSLKKEVDALESFYLSLAIRSEILGEEDESVIDAKEFYRSLSDEVTLTPLSTSQREETQILQSSDSQLVVVILEAASLAVRKNQPEIALELLELSKRCINGTEEVPEYVAQTILAAYITAQS